MASEGAVSGISGGFRFWSSQRAARLDGGGDPLSLEWGARIELRVLAHLATCSECVIPSWLELQSGPGRHAWLPSLWQWLGRNGWARLLLLRASPPVLGSRRGVDGSHRTQTARAARRWLRRRQRSSSVSWWEECVVFLAILAVARMVIWTTRNKGLYDDANFSHRDLVLYFRHQLRVKIRCDRKRLDRITFSKRWVTAASLVVRKGAMLESSFPPLPVHGVYGTGP